MIHYVFFHLRQEIPESIMLQDVISPDPGTLTYREVCDKVKTGAAAFQKLGLLPGSCVAVFAENSHKWLIAEQAGISMLNWIHAIIQNDRLT